MADDSRSEIVHRELDTEREQPAIAIVEIVAELKGREVDELATMWGCMDGVLDHVFSDPPSPEAQVEIAFSYEGYRITVDQDGMATVIEP